MNKPLIVSFLNARNFGNQPGPMMTIAIDKLDVGVWFLKLLIVPLRSASIFNIFSTGENRGKVFCVKR